MWLKWEKLEFRKIQMGKFVIWKLQSHLSISLRPKAFAHALSDWIEMAPAL